MSIRAKWFTDELINRYICKLKEIHKRDSVGFFDCYVTDLMTIKVITDDGNAMRKWCIATKKICDLDTKNFIVIPFQADGNHWVLCVVIPRTHHILLYDSFCGEYNRIEISQLWCIDKVKDFLCNYGLINGVEHFYAIPWLTVPIPFDRVQNDKYTCGTFVVIVAHLFSILPEGQIPTLISIKNIEKIHKYLLNEFSQTKTISILDKEIVFTGLKMGKLNLDTIQAIDILRGKNYCEDGILKALFHPMINKSSETRAPQLYEKRHNEKRKENINVLGEKRSVYSQPLEFDKDSMIIADKFVIDSFGIANRDAIERIAENIMETVKDAAMIEHKRYTIDLFCDFHFGNNFFLLERCIMRYISIRSIGQCDVYINVVMDGLAVDTLVPFHDYCQTEVKNIVKKKRDSIHDVIDRNDALYSLMSHNGDMIKVKTWESWMEWMDCPRTHPGPSVRILILGNEDTKRELSCIRDDFLLSRCEDTFLDPKNKRILVSILFEREKDELYTQILFRKDPHTKYTDNQEEKKIVSDYPCMKKLICVESEKEWIVTFYSHLKHAILCDALQPNKKRKSSAILIN